MNLKIYMVIIKVKKRDLNFLKNMYLLRSKREGSIKRQNKNIKIYYKKLILWIKKMLSPMRKYILIPHKME